MDPQHFASLEDYSLTPDHDVVAYLSAQYGEQHFQKILTKLKIPPAYTSLRVNTLKTTVDEVLETLKSLLANSDVEYQIKVHTLLPDCLIIQSTKHLIETKKGKLEESISENDHRTMRSILVDRLCGESVLRGSDIFIKGIISAQKGINKGSICEIYSHIDDRGYNFNRGALLDSYQGYCVYLGTGIAEVSRTDMFTLQSGVGIKMKSTVTPQLPPLNGVLNGLILMQNIPSLVVPLVLDPSPGDTILDMCAAPGGKTSHLAALMKNQGLIVACDKSKKKMLTARDRFVEMGATCIIPLALDSTNMLVTDLSSKQTPLEIVKTSILPTGSNKLRPIKKFHPESFDKILLDPPCSALGLRPKLSIQWGLEELKKTANYQKQFIKQAVLLLKSGGTLTYSTCTINADENERMVRWILDNFPCLLLAPIKFTIGQPGLQNVGLNDLERNMVRRFDPCDSDDTMGFFVSKFIKR